MSRREFSLAPLQPAITRARSIYVAGGRKSGVRRMPFGPAVLRPATAEQPTLAMPRVEAGQRLTRAGIQEMSARQ